MINPISFIDEEYKFVTQNMVPNIDIGRYLISNYGTILDTWRNNTQIHQNNYCNGYMRATLHLENGQKKMILVHRLVALWLLYQVIGLFK